MMDLGKSSLLREILGAKQDGNDNKSDKCRRIKINVEEGDVFVLNTKIWYHCTELNFSPNPTSSVLPSEWSISAAQYFICLFLA